MADKIKKFFKNKELENTFRSAGPGFKLNETPSSSTSSSIEPEEYHAYQQRSGLTQETTMAAAAALARLEGKQKNSSTNKSFTTIQAQVRRELAAEKESMSHSMQYYQKRKETELESPGILAASGVFFRCPLISEEVLTRDEWNVKIRNFLYEQLEDEKGLIACLILNSLNKSPEKVNACTDIIKKYFSNILENPNEEKYRKIRLGNKVYQEKVMPMEGALQVLEAVGFEKRKLPSADGEEEYLVYPDEKLPQAREQFELMIDLLREAGPIQLELDRNLQVLLPSQAKERCEFSAMFYNLTIDDIKREQQLRTEAIEKSQMLRTKAMRERDEIHEVRRYKFCVIRIRFPEDVLLQGTFGVSEKISAVMDFVRDTLVSNEIQFSLTTPTGQTLTDENASLQELKLIPAAVLNFRSSAPLKCFLKEEVMVLLQPVS